MSQAGRESALLGHVGRKRIQFASTDDLGRLLPDSIRAYPAEEVISISGALAAYWRSTHSTGLPERSAIAIGGLARGDTMSVTKTRWILSRSGLQAMLGHPPLIINDFAAEAWALYGSDVRPQEMFSNQAPLSLRRPGCYCVIGMTSGLGVSVLTCSENGAVTVLSTEAGHSGFVAGSERIARLATDMFPDIYPIQAEDLLSAPGLLAIYNELSRKQGTVPKLRTPEEITRDFITDEMAFRACLLLCQAFWSYAGSLTLAYGAWDGILVTGGLAGALRSVLRRPEMQAMFVGEGKFRKTLEQVPRGYASLDNGGLVGAAEALQHQHRPAVTA
jgi:glucokinase